MELQSEVLDINMIKFQLDSAIATKQTLANDLERNKDTLIDLEHEVKVLEDVKILLESLKNYKMDSKKEFILNTINSALQDVFEQNVRIDIEMSSSNKSGASTITTRYDIVLYQNDIEISRNEKLLENNGGGILSFISILFKILVGYIYSNSKFYLFDESISQVSGSYRPRLARFLRKFCEEFGFTIILISHTDDIDEHAHTGYRLQGKFDKNGIPELSIGDTFGEYPDHNYNYVKIKNFQSIVDAEFRYKGFCVIRGDNNIGKSASFRAINALLFNTFDTNDFPRLQRPRGSNVEIEFGYFKTENDIAENETNKIKLVYKASQKVVYEFDGEEYAGKALAFEKIKDKVETLGFKYVNLKETYKNFKGNLKDQTERLALTTQHDGFYLVGNKSNETEKVFNFLFDSTAVSAAIMNAENDARDLNNRYQMLTAANNKIVIQLKQQDILIEKFSMLYYIYYIKEYKRRINLRVNLSNHIDVAKDYADLIVKIFTIKNNVAEYIQELAVRDDIVTKKLKLDYCVEICNKAIAAVNDKDAYMYYINAINSYKSLCLNRINIENSITYFNTSINTINKCLTHYNVIQDMKNIINDIKIHKVALDIRTKIAHETAVETNYKTQLENIFAKFNTLTSEIHSYKYYIDAIKKYINDLNMSNDIIYNQKNIEGLIFRLNSWFEIFNARETLARNIEIHADNVCKRNRIINDTLFWENQKAIIMKEYMETIPVCPCCGGTGIDPSHPAHAAKLLEVKNV